MIKNLQNSYSAPKRVRRQTRSVTVEKSVLEEVDSLLEEEVAPMPRKSIGIVKSKKEPAKKFTSAPKKQRRSNVQNEVVDIVDDIVGTNEVEQDADRRHESVESTTCVFNVPEANTQKNDECEGSSKEKKELMVYNKRFIRWRENCPMNGVYPALFAEIICNGKDESLDSDIEFNNAVISTICEDEDVSTIYPSVVLDDTEVEMEPLIAHMEVNAFNKEETRTADEDFPPEETEDIEGFEMY